MADDKNKPNPQGDSQPPNPPGGSGGPGGPGAPGGPGRPGEDDAGEKEKKRATNQKETFKAGLPDVKSTALAGTITADDQVQIEAQILAYAAMARAAAKIVAEIKAAEAGNAGGGNGGVANGGAGNAAGVAAKAGKIIVHSAVDQAAMTAYRGLRAQMDVLEAAYAEELREPEPNLRAMAAGAAVPLPMVGMAASAVIGSIADALAFFRTDVEIKGKKIEIMESALVSAIAKGLPGRVLYPAVLMPPPMEDDFKQSNLLDSFRSLSESRLRAQGRFKELEAQTLEQKKAAGKDDATIAEEAGKAARLKQLNDAWDKLAGGLTSTDDKTGAGLLANLLRTEKLVKLTSDARTCVLALTISATGGSNRIKKSLWPWCSSLSHSGGCVVHYQLYSSEGAIVAANVIPAYTGYFEFGKEEVKPRGTEMPALDSFVRFT